ncbi:phosphate ABC transporter substrate-binding protein PstS [Gordonia sp. (in: high G+C Gram-positive bacteria)]|uniref:phosphate ABC transporter substrate-binding protein PstS n=1 Tax=Gordonia sp. (in: high G+C Gram-positive bacteria) TaxID=84139 RepID=UPI0026032443|nr:phosphate ABC transporter substrate-binding protein PstS [Gordonia sp. (in: high G+C Gram-positive bacteria)]
MSAISKTTARTSAALSVAVAAGLLLSACGGSGSQTTVTGEGATSQQKAMTYFADVLTKNSDVVLDYTGSGSGAGVKKFIAGDVDFAGSDSPLKPDEATDAKKRCGGNDAWHLPLVAGPVAIAYHLDGVDKLNLNAAVLAGIFDSKITKWNDPKIAALNPGVKLPDTAVVPVHRTDSSGTTENFTRYLSVAAPAEWTHKPSKEWAGQGGSGAAKSTGVGDTVKKTPGAITYVEWGFATENKLGVANLDFGAGPTELTAQSAGKALENAKFANPGSKDLVVDTDALFGLSEEGAYPLMLTTYEIVCSKGYSDSKTGPALKTAFSTILDKGQDGLADLGFVPLPAQFTAALRGTVDALG